MIIRPRWALAGALISLVGLALGLIVADQFPHGYSGNTIRIRGWLLRLSWGLTCAALLGAGCLAFATRGLARIAFGAAALAWLAHGLVLGRYADQPLAPGSGAVTMLTVLVFLPSVLRAVAFAGWRPLIVLAAGDLAVIGFTWSQTPVEVLGRAHAAQQTGWMLLPALFALGAVAAMALRAGRSVEG